MHVPQPVLFVLVVMLAFGCAKKSQKAVVIAKDYIPAHIEGTEYQERQTDREQWLVKVEMEGGRKADAPVDKVQWESLKVGDRVHASYSEGKHTGTIWAIELRKP
jgi:hypothetical protein